MVFNQVANDQPLNGPNQPTLYMNPTTPVKLQGYNITFPGYLPWSPGSAIPFGGPQRLLQVYQDQTWLKGGHDFRFGGFVRQHRRRSDVRCVCELGRSVEHDVGRADLPGQPGPGAAQAIPDRDQPQGYPGGTYTTPVGLPSFLSKNRYNEFALYANDDWSLTSRLR